MKEGIVARNHSTQASANGINNVCTTCGWRPAHKLFTMWRIYHNTVGITHLWLGKGTEWTRNQQESLWAKKLPSSHFVLIHWLLVPIRSRCGSRWNDSLDATYKDLTSQLIVGIFNPDMTVTGTWFDLDIHILFRTKHLCAPRMFLCQARSIKPRRKLQLCMLYLYFTRGGVTHLL